jgi:starvation-inducible DNA-binding protein
MQPTRNLLPENIQAQSVDLLNKYLAAAIDLHAQMKQAHWNVLGPNFIATHELFDKVSVEVENYSDLIAERAGALGGTAHGTIQLAAERSFLVPYPLDIAGGLRADRKSPLAPQPPQPGSNNLEHVLRLHA